MTNVFDNGKLKQAQDGILDAIVEELEIKPVGERGIAHPNVIKDLAESFNLLQFAAAKE
jgi:hypothetical protein